MNKVMIATPIDSRKLYCFKEWAETIRFLNAEEVVVCDTSVDRVMEVHIKNEGFTYLHTHAGRDMDNVVAARNMLRDYFLEKDFTHILFIDADIFAPRSTIPQLLSSRRAVVTAFCPIFNGDEAIPIPSAKVYRDGKLHAFPIELIDGSDYDVDVIGFGCVLIEREVMVEFNIRCERDKLGRVKKSEDWCFSDNIRKEFGMCFNTGVNTKHKISGDGHWDWSEA
jgi:hypothetical protein